MHSTGGWHEDDRFPVAWAEPIERFESLGVSGARMGDGHGEAHIYCLWNTDSSAGFCPPAATPWLPLAPNADRLTVAAQLADPHSMLVLTRTLRAVRRENPALWVGSYGPWTTYRMIALRTSAAPVRSNA